MAIATGLVRDVRNLGLALLMGTSIIGASSSMPLAQTAPNDRVVQKNWISGNSDETIPLDLLDGTLSGLGDLEADNAERSGHFRLPTALGEWFAFKQEIAAKYGLSFGGSFGVLGQYYSNSLVDESYAVGQKTTFNFSYDLLNRGSPDALTFDLVVEDRGPIGTKLPPLFGGLASGSIVPPAATWGDFDLGITQAYIRQSLFNNHFQYTVGKVFAPNYLNAYPFFDDNRQFLNQTFSTGPTIASPLRGFGAVAAWYPTDTGLYLQSGIYTANSSDTGSTIKDFFTNDEHFYHFDIGWSGLAQTGTPINARGPMDANNVHVTLWHKDKQDSGIPEAEGAAFNVNYMVDDNVMVFLRGGLSDGWFVDRNLSAGFGWRPDNGTNDLFGLGAGWAHPSSDALDSQYTAEAFYRYQLTPNLALTPDLQMIVNPSLAPDVDVLWVASVRARVTF